MNAASAFQHQYPLSPKKFKKKIITQLPRMVLTALFFSIVVGVISLLIWLVKNTGTLAADVKLAGTAPFFIGGLGFLVIFVLYIVLYVWYIKTYIRRYYYDSAEQFLTI